MKKIQIRKNYKSKMKYSFKKGYNFSRIYNYIFKRNYSFLTPINFILTIYLLIQNHRANNFMKELSTSNVFSKIEEPTIDKDMIGLTYPEIMFQKIKDEYKNGKIISSFCDFLKQLEIKLIYLEKEINITKLYSFYNIRTSYLKSKNVNYDESKINEFHDIINWVVIHKSNQLKGIASDKYLACKYATIKLGKNLCPQRIGVFDTIEEIDFQKIIIMGNVILKVTNGFADNIFISDKTTVQDIDKIKENLKYHFNRDYSLMIPDFFHLYSKKRIVLEKTFMPRDELYEFRFMVFNRKIKMVILNYRRGVQYYDAFYDENFNSIKDIQKVNLDITIFNKSVWNTMKDYAIKLSEDFPNFIRVDLYVFHNEIFLSELTFGSHNGMPTFRDIKYFTDGLKNWERCN